ncbi:MAG: serine proteinase [Candidatus Onthomonas sp.]
MTFNVDELKKKVMDLGQTGLNMAQTGVDKSIQLAAVAKLRAANVKEESNLRAAYVELGKLYFADHGAQPEEAYSAACALIADIQAAIAANNAKIAEIKIAPDVEVEVEVEAGEVPEDAPVEEETAPAVEKEPPAPAEEAAPAEPEVPAEEENDYGFTN